MNSVSVQLLDLIEAELPYGPPGARPSTIWQSFGQGSVVTVRHALRDLCSLGRAEFTGPNGKRRYWRRPNPSP